MTVATRTTTSLAPFLRRSLPTLLLLGGASALLLFTDRTAATRDVPAVAVLQQVSTTLLDDAVEGMLEGLAERGYSDGKTVTIRRYNAEGDLAQANAIAREIAGGAFDLEVGDSAARLPTTRAASSPGTRIRERLEVPTGCPLGFQVESTPITPRRSADAAHRAGSRRAGSSRSRSGYRCGR